MKLEEMSYRDWVNEKEKKLEQLKGFEDWMRAERGDIFEELVEEYIEYKRELSRDNICLEMEDKTRYIVPNIPANKIIELLKENNIEIKNIKRIRSRF